MYNIEIGIHQYSETQRILSMYLGPDKMIVQQRDDGKIITKEVFPISIREDLEAPLIAAIYVSNPFPTCN